MHWNSSIRLAVGGALAAALLAFSATDAPAASLHDGLLSYWSLDEGAGATAGDVFGGTNDDGALRNSPTWLGSGSAKFGASALALNGVDQDVLLPTGGDMDIGASAVTLSAWVNLTTLPTDIPEAFMGILDATEDNYVMYLDKGNSELRFKVTDSNGTAERPGVPQAMLSTGGWHHVMGVYDGASGTAKIFYDGVLADVHYNAGLIDPVRTGQVGAIGSNPSTTAPPAISYYDGSLDDVAIWNRPLGAAEAQYLYNAGTGAAVGAANPNLETIVAPGKAPVVHLKFDGNLQSSGTGGSAYDGTLLDTPGVNDSLYTNTTAGQGLDLRENPDSPTGGDGVSVDYTMTDQGTVSFFFTVDKYYNYQTLFSNSVQQDDWEMWIYGDGRLRGRIQSDSFIEKDLDDLGGLDETYHVAMTWSRTSATAAIVQLYIDGELVSEDAGSWVAPGSTVFIGGGDGANDYGSGIFDDFRIYDVVLDGGEIQYLSQVPEPSSAALLALAGSVLAWRRTRRRGR